MPDNSIPSDNVTPSLQNQAGTDTGYDYNFEQRWCSLERSLWLAFCGVILIGLLGFLGRGPLNHSKLQRPDHSTVKYERVLRYHTPTLLELQLPVIDGRAELTLDKADADKLGLKQIVPQPTRNLGSTKTGPFVFESGDRDAESILVVLSLEPANIGPITTHLSVNGQTQITVGCPSRRSYPTIDLLPMRFWRCSPSG